MRAHAPEQRIGVARQRMVTMPPSAPELDVADAGWSRGA
jgi:hypothetical protein